MSQLKYFNTKPARIINTIRTEAMLMEYFMWLENNLIFSACFGYLGNISLSINFELKICFAENSTLF